MLSPMLIQQLIEGIQQHFNLSQLQEFTFEANPATFTEKKIQLLKQLGVTRVSLGIQSFSDRVLSILGREHSRQQAIDSVFILREAGLPEINIDLMFAVPGQPLEEWIDTLETAISLKSDHISSYNLTYEEDTAFIEKLSQGEFHEDEELNAQYFEVSHQLLTKAGFDHYETSNYAKSGKKSKHNQAYWQGANYLGLGPSAVGTVAKKRYKNIADTARYVEMINHIGHAQTEVEHLTEEDYRIERIALLLRTTNGLPKHWLQSTNPKAIEILLEEKLATWHKDKLLLINNGPMLVDAIAERLI